MSNLHKIEYAIVIDPNVVDEWFGNMTPFNLKRDLKQFSAEQRKYLSRELAATIKAGVSRSYIEIKKEYISNIKITISKLKITDDCSNKGKSSGYRCITLVDNINFRCFLLHIYKHNVKDNITKSEENKLYRMLKLYVSSL